MENEEGLAIEDDGEYTQISMFTTFTDRVLLYILIFFGNGKPDEQRGRFLLHQHEH